MALVPDSCVRRNERRVPDMIETATLALVQFCLNRSRVYASFERSAEIYHWNPGGWSALVRSVSTQSQRISWDKDTYHKRGFAFLARPFPQKNRPGKLLRDREAEGTGWL